MLNTTIDETLEAEFALRQRHPEREEVYDGHRQRSAALRARGNCLLDQRYGSGPRCLLDVFPSGDGAPVLFFIHGGYWRGLPQSGAVVLPAPFPPVGLRVFPPGPCL